MPDDETPTSEIKLTATYDNGREAYPLLELEAVKGVDSKDHLIELLWFAIKSCDEVEEA